MTSEMAHKNTNRNLVIEEKKTEKSSSHQYCSFVLNFFDLNVSLMSNSNHVAFRFFLHFVTD